MFWLYLPWIFVFFARAFSPAATGDARMHACCVAQEWLRQHYLSCVLDKHGPEGLEAFARAVDMVHHSRLDITPLPTLPAESPGQTTEVPAPRVSGGGRHRRATRSSVPERKPDRKR